MKWFDDWIQVFKIGTHTDSCGNERTWTHSDLDKIIAAYSAQNEQAPVVLGHPKTDDPAYGWVSAIKRDGDVLLAKFEKLCPEFINWVEKGLYRKISIALSADLSLRHIGFLGAATPAVKGLSNAFCDDEVFYFALEPLGINTPQTALWQVNKRSLTKRSRSGENCLSARSVRVGEPGEMSLGTQEREQAGVFVKLFGEKVSPVREDIASFKEKNMFKKPTTAEFSAKIEELETKLEFAQKTAQRQAQSDFLANLQKDAKITAEDKVRLERVFEALSTFGVEFAEGENTDGTSFCDELRQVLTNLPKRVEMNEIATSQNAPKGTYRTPQEELGMKIANSI